MEVSVYTDGGCRGNPGPGGWAAVISAGGRRHRLSGSQPATTNNRMELTALIKALEFVSSSLPGSKATVHTDSQYVKLGITTWIRGWVRNGWKTADRKPVKNQDLWLSLKELNDRLAPEYFWVRGHDGNPLNEECDKLVGEEIRKLAGPV